MRATSSPHRCALIAKHGATDAHHTEELHALCDTLDARAPIVDRRRIVHCAETVAQLYRIS